METGNYSRLFSIAVVVICLSGLISTNATRVFKDGNCIDVDNDPSKIICVCDEKFCDDLIFEWPQKSGQASIVETTKSGLRFKTTKLGNVDYQSRDSVGQVRVNLATKRQKIMGWGGAFTDAATINMRQLTPDLTEKLLQSYFGTEGLAYNFGRVPIAGSDFSTRTYSYDDSQADYNLTDWSLAEEDIKFKIPAIKRASEIVSTTGESLKLFASPWTPPKWMKTNNDFTRGYLIDEDKVYKSYADYLVKFYRAYREKGVEFWGATVQNEPITSFSPVYFFNSLQMGNAQAIKFISKFLGPALEAEGYTKKNFKLMVGDDSLGFINLQVPQIMKEEGVRKYVSGLAFHWYTSGVVAPYNLLTEVVDAIRGHIEFVIMSEACEGWLMGSKHVDLGSWDRGESYASDIMQDLKRETGAWIDWNLALNTTGGPNWANNQVDSPIIVDQSSNKFYKQPMYYTLGHFSRFFKPDSVYIEPELVGDQRSFDGLTFAAVEHEATGHIAVNILNKADGVRNFKLVVDDQGNLKHQINSISVQPKSISTVVVKL